MIPTLTQCSGRSLRDPHDKAFDDGGTRDRRRSSAAPARGFYTTPAGHKDLPYFGNVALASCEGTPADDTEAMRVAASICVYTNETITVEEL